MCPQKVYTLPSQSALVSYGLSRNGFLPADEPLTTIDNPYYEPWERIVAQLPVLIKDRTIRTRIDDLPVLSTCHLDGEAEWQRAFLMLAAMAQGYIWCGETPSERLPPAISIPFISAASRLDVLPVASYAALNLWNWKTSGPNADLTNPDDLRTTISFTGTEDESWFFIISNAMEARAAPLIRTMLSVAEAIQEDDVQMVIEGLRSFESCLLDIGNLLERMDERCSPQTFYHHIRPFLGGSLNDRLPRGVFYDEGNGQGSWRKYRGGSNGQSSVVQFFDAALGIEHTKTRSFHQEMRAYMPGPHGKFLDDFSALVGVREYVQIAQHAQLRSAYNAAVQSLSLFRDKHIQIVTRYVILPSRMASPSHQAPQGSLASHLTTPTDNAKKVVGTGGTDLVPFLRQSRDETKTAICEGSSVVPACA